MNPIATVLIAGTLASITIRTPVIAQASPADQAQTGRAKVLGIVESLTGQPWVNANVVLVSRPVGDDETIGDADLLNTRTDAQGLFRADVLRHRSYTVWAHTDKDTKGMFRMTRVAESVLAGPPITLRPEFDSPQRVIELRVRGLEAWKHRGPLTFQLVSQTGNLYVVALRPTNVELIQLPPMPGRKQSLEIRDRDGVLICAVNDVPCSHRMKWTPTVIRVPPPTTVRFSAQAAEGAEPVVGGRVLMRLRRTLRLVGVTGKEGFVEIELGDQKHQFLVDAPGYALGMCLSREGNTSHLKSAPKVAAQRPDWFALLLKGKGIRGRIVTERHEQLRGVRLIAHTAAWYHKGSSTTIRVSVEIGKNGSFRLPGQTGAETSVQLVLTAPGQLGRGFVGVHPIVPCVVPLQNEGAAPVLIRLANLRPVEIFVRSPDGQPAAGAKVNFLTSSRVHLKPTDGLSTNTAGRARVVLLAGTTVTVLIRAGSREGVRSVVTGVWTLDQPKSTATPTMVRVQLRRPLSISGYGAQQN